MQVAGGSPFGLTQVFCPMDLVCTGNLGPLEGALEANRMKRLGAPRAGELRLRGEGSAGEAWHPSWAHAALGEPNTSAFYGSGATLGRFSTTNPVQLVVMLHFTDEKTEAICRTETMKLREVKLAGNWSPNLNPGLRDPSVHLFSTHLPNKLSSPVTSPPPHTARQGEKKSF